MLKQLILLPFYSMYKSSSPMDNHEYPFLQLALNKYTSHTFYKIHSYTFTLCAARHGFPLINLDKAVVKTLFLHKTKFKLKYDQPKQNE